MAIIRMLKLYVEELIDRIPDAFRYHLEVILEESARIVVIIASTTFLNLILLSFCYAAWGLYSETQVGRYFIVNHPSYYGTLTLLFEKDFFEFSLELTMLVFTYCIIIAVISQFTYIRHICYSSQNILVKAAWVFPLAMLIAEPIQDLYQIEHWNSAFLIALPGTLALFAGCMTAASNLVPEVGATFAMIYNRIREWL